LDYSTYFLIPWSYDVCIIQEMIYWEIENAFINSRLIDFQLKEKDMVVYVRRLTDDMRKNHIVCIIFFFIILMYIYILTHFRVC